MKPSAIALKRVVLVDTGPLVAAIDAGDSHHAWAKATLPKLSGRLLTCEAVASEAAHLLDNDPAAMASLHVFLGRMEIVPVLRDELDQVALDTSYRDDTRDFSTYRVPFASPEGLFAEK